MTHKIALQGYDVLLLEEETLTLGTLDSYGTEFLYVRPGEGWKEMEVTAAFLVSGQGAVRVRLGSDGIIPVPQGAMARVDGAKEDRKLVFTGVKEGTRRITADLPYRVGFHGCVTGELAGEPEPDLVDELLLAAKNAEALAASVREDADRGKFDGAPGAAPVLTMGTVQTLPAGSEAAASFTGTAAEPVLNLAIPKGDAGGVVSVNGVLPDEDGNVALEIRIPEQPETPFGEEIMLEGTGVILPQEAQTLTALAVYGKSVPADTPAWTAPVDLRHVGSQERLICCAAGKNVQKPLDQVETVSGISIEAKGDGQITLNGTATALMAVRLPGITVIPGQVYSLSANNGQASSGTLLRFSRRPVDTLVLNDTNLELTAVNAERTVVFDTAQITMEVRVAAGTVLSGFTLKPQLELGETATEWEAYQGGDLVFTDGPALYGIGASTGTNVAIDGQEYISDVLEVGADGRGRMIRNCYVKVFTGTESISYSSTVKCFLYATDVTLGGNTDLVVSSHLPYIRINSLTTENGVCSLGASLRWRTGETDVTAMKEYLAAQYAAGTPFTVIARRETPQVKLLSEAEVRDFLGLKLQSPATSLTAQGGWMHVSYATGRLAQVWDVTRKAVGNLSERLERLTYAILSLGGNV